MKRVLLIVFIFSFLVCALNLPGRLAWAGPNEDLIQAANVGNLEGERGALRAGADVNVKGNDGDTALRAAAWNGHANVIPLLLRAGADVNSKDMYGGTALMYAADMGYANVIPLLLQAGADVDAKNTDGVTALMGAAMQGQANVIPLLLRAGADVYARNKDGSTAEDLARRIGKTEIITLLDDWNASHSGTAVASTESSTSSSDNSFSSPSTSSGISRTEAQDIAAQAAKQAVEQANAAMNQKLAVLSAKPAPPKVPTYHSSVDRPDYREPRHRKDFALVIGVEQYPRPIHAAIFADQDAQAMFAHLRALGVPVRHIKRLTGDTATRSRIESALHWLKRNVQPGATVYVYFSGHGAPGRSGDAYLVPFDGDPSDLSETALPVSTLYEDLETLPAKHVIVALDACFTGEGKRSVLGSGIRPLVTKIREGPVPSSGKLVVSPCVRIVVA